MPINAHPDFLAAEKEYLLAVDPEEKIEKLKKMISLCPSHKGAENLRAQLRARLKRLQEQLIRFKKTKKGPQGIKKYDVQAVIIGETNTGKSLLLSKLTNTHPEITPYGFTTKKSLQGMIDYHGAQMQLVENPAIESEYYDKSLTHTADTILIIVTSIEQIDRINQEIKNERASKIIIFNIKKNLDRNEKRKIESTLKSKRYNYIIIDADSGEYIEDLKEKIFKSFNKIRIFTKEPRKEKSNKPIVLPKGSTVMDVAEKILHGFSNKVKETKIWGPSSKFSGQIVSFRHVLKDMDIVEFKTK